MPKSNIVFTSANPIEAQIVKGVLETNDIPAFLLDENINRINPFYSLAVGGIKVVVPSPRVEEARRVLHEWGQTPEGKKIEGQVSPFEFLGKTPRPENRLFTLILSLFFLPAALLAWLGFNSRRK